MQIRRYVQVGVGGRSQMFWDAVMDKYKEHSQLLAICDNNKGRMDYVVNQAKEKYGTDLKTYSADEFDKMIEENKPDTVIVTSKDSTHDEYICRAMELGCDAITEKPMTTDEQKAQRIIDTQKKTGKKVTVTFNYRYSPPRSQIKDLLMSGVIGDIISVDFNWLLDTKHGADYFRRWHRNKANSGGLMVHKATHHFDLVNWWLSDVPDRIFASGGRNFYVPRTADRYGLKNRGERCLDCPESKKCPFSLIEAITNKGEEPIEKSLIHKLYYNCEKYDGYFRDRCVFSDKIDIEDTMNVLVDYKGGARLCYSLSAFCAWEGHIVSFNGTKGRLEHKCQESVYINADGSVPGALNTEGTFTKIYPHWGTPYEVDVWQGAGGHGGGDVVMLNYIFDAENQTADKYLRAADYRGGAYSILVGVAANKSMASGRTVKIEDLVTGLDAPDYPAMPQRTEPLPLKKQ